MKPGTRAPRVESAHYAVLRPFIDAANFWSGLGESPYVAFEEYLKGDFCDLVLYPDAYGKADPVLVAEIKSHLRRGYVFQQAISQVRRYRNFFITEGRGCPQAYVVCPDIGDDLIAPDDVKAMTPEEFAVPFGRALRGLEPVA